MKAFKWMVPAALMLVMSASIASAQAPALKGQWAFGALGGLAVPSGDLSDEDIGNMGMGWDAGAQVDYFVTDAIGIGADFGYASMTDKDVDEVKAKTLAYGAHLKWIIPAGEKVLPYLWIGGGMQSRKIEGDTGSFTIEIDDTKPQVNGGVGLEWMMNEMVGIGVNGGYHLGIGKFEEDLDGDGVEEVLAENWNYIAFNAALTFHFSPSK